MRVLRRNEIDQQTIKRHDLRCGHMRKAVLRQSYPLCNRKERRFFSLVATATTTLSNSLAALSMRSIWPLVMGSNVPGYTTVCVSTACFLSSLLGAYTSLVNKSCWPQDHVYSAWPKLQELILDIAGRFLSENTVVLFRDAFWLRSSGFEVHPTCLVQAPVSRQRFQCGFAQ